MKYTTIAAVAMLASLGTGSLNADQSAVFRWVDENGITHFTDTPPVGTDSQQTDVRFSRTDPAQLQARVDGQREKREQARELRQEADEADGKASAQRAEETAERRKRCEEARKVVKSYESTFRLYRESESGEREYLNDAEIDAARAQAAQAVRDWCD